MLKRRVVMQTLNGPETIEGATVRALKEILKNANDDAVVVFMFETTPTVRDQMNKVPLMIMPLGAVACDPENDICVCMGPEIMNAFYETKEVMPDVTHDPNDPTTGIVTEGESATPPVDRSNQCTTSGESPEDVRKRQDEDGNKLHDSYIVLCDEERKKGFVRPYRDAYRHIECGHITTMGRTIAETYARDPGFYGSTYCSHCQAHFPVGADGEFTWYEMDGTEGPKVGT